LGEDSERIDGVSACYAVVRIRLSSVFALSRIHKGIEWPGPVRHTFPLFGI